MIDPEIKFQLMEVLVRLDLDEALRQIQFEILEKLPSAKTPEEAFRIKLEWDAAYSFMEWIRKELQIEN